MYIPQVAGKREKGGKHRVVDEERHVYTYMKTTNTGNNGVSNRFVHTHTHVRTYILTQFSTCVYARTCIIHTYSYIRLGSPLRIKAPMHLPLFLLFFASFFSAVPARSFTPFITRPPFSYSYSSSFSSLTARLVYLSIRPSQFTLSFCLYLKAILPRSTWMNRKRGRPPLDVR